MSHNDTLPTFCAYHPVYMGSEYQIRGPAPLEGEDLSHGICLACYREFCRREGLEPNPELIGMMEADQGWPL